MATQYQLRRGTTSEVLLFTGAQGEVVVNTDTHALVVQDGVTAGGFPSATLPQVTNGTFYYNEDAGSISDSYILVPKANTNTPSTYADGVQFGFITTHPNTGPATANFQGLGVKNLKYPGGIDPLAGEINGRVYLIYDAGNGWLEIQRKATGPTPQLRSIGASVALSALTVTLAPSMVDFRATSLGSGVINSRSITSTISLVVPNGATLGTVNAVSSRLVLLAIYGPTNVELAIVNLTQSLNLDETTLISTTAITASSNAAGVAYSTIARASVPFRVVGFVDSTQATAGAWNTSPSLIQGAGGLSMNSLSAIIGLGYGQTWQSVTRAFSTTYTNTTGKPILASVWAFSASSSFLSIQILINGTVMGLSPTTPNTSSSTTAILGFLIPIGATYSVSIASGTGTLNDWKEFR